MNQGEILQAIQNGVKIAVSQSDMSSLPIKFVDVILNPQPEKYLEVVFIPNNPGSGTWGDDRTYMGFFRLILHWPKSSQGAYEPLTLIDRIGSYFTKDRRPGGLQISDVPDCTGSIDGGADLLYAVTIRYTHFVPA